MAKSIRSKRKIKMRNVKREKVYGPKELVRLKNCLALGKSKDQDEPMKDLVTVTDAKTVMKEKQEREAMEVDGEGSKKYNSKTKLDDNGQYPQWMNQRAIKKARKKRTDVKKRKGKKVKGVKW